MYSEDGMTKTGKKWKWLELNMPINKKKKTSFFVNGIGKKKSCFLLVEIGALKESISPSTNYLITNTRKNFQQKRISNFYLLFAKGATYYVNVFFYFHIRLFLNFWTN